MSTAHSVRNSYWQDCIYDFSDQPMKMDDAAKARNQVQVVKHDGEGTVDALLRFQADSDAPTHSPNQASLRRIYKQLSLALAPFESTLSEILFRMPSPNNPVVSMKVC
jgi:hypothetical protein